MTKLLWADFKSDLSDTRQHWHISFRYGWYISKCYRWYISFRYDWHNSFRCRWHIDSVAIKLLKFRKLLVFKSWRIKTDFFPIFQQLQKHISFHNLFWFYKNKHKS